MFCFLFCLFVSIFGNADLFCLILQLGWCCHSDVCGIPHCVPEVHGKFYAWPHQDKSHPMDGRVSSRTRNLFWLPGDSDSVYYSFVTIIKYHSAIYIHVTMHRNGFIFNNQPDALIIQIYSIIKLCFGHPLCPSSGVLCCTFGTGKFHAEIFING